MQHVSVSESNDFARPAMLDAPLPELGKKTTLQRGARRTGRRIGASQGLTVLPVTEIEIVISPGR